MANEVDYYDVQNMIRDAVGDLRAELRAAVDELRQDLGTERVERQDAIESLARVDRVED